MAFRSAREFLLAIWLVAMASLEEGKNPNNSKLPRKKPELGGKN